MSCCERELIVRGRRVHCLCAGTPGPRPAFVLLHGLGGSAEHWRVVLGLLGEHAHVVALDLPGFGHSEMPRDPVSIDGLAGVVGEAIAALDLAPVVLVGHSFAGPLAVRCVVERPELAAGLVLLGGAVLQFSSLLGLRAVGPHLRARPRATVAILAEVLGSALPLPATLRRAVARSAPLRRLALWPYVLNPAALSPDRAALLLSGVGARGVIPTVRAIGRSNPTEGLGSVRCPVLSLAGACDLIVPLGDSEALQREMPDARTRVFGDCGHMAMLEHPHAFADQLLAFAGELAGPPTPTPEEQTP